jgi:hypothetical protein
MVVRVSPTTVERMKRYEIDAFIRNARFVSSDPAVEQNMLNDRLGEGQQIKNRE